MIAKKTKKPTKTGYDLNNIQTKKTSQPKRKNGALHGFFSLMGVIIGIGSIMALIVPIAISANQGVYIVEPFECETEILNYHELKRVLKLDIPQFQRDMQELDLNLTTASLIKYECEGFKDAN